MRNCFKITTLAEICIKCVIFIEKLQKSPALGGGGLRRQTLLPAADCLGL